MAILLRNVTVVQPQLCVLGRLSKQVLQSKVRSTYTAYTKSDKQVVSTEDESVVFTDTNLLKPTEGIENVDAMKLEPKCMSSNATPGILESLTVSPETVDSPHAVVPERTPRFLPTRVPFLASGTATPQTVQHRALRLRTQQPFNDSSDFEFVDMALYPEAEPFDGALVLQLKGALHFANIGRIQV